MNARRQDCRQRTCRRVATRIFLASCTWDLRPRLLHVVASRLFVGYFGKGATTDLAI